MTRNLTLARPLVVVERRACTHCGLPVPAARLDAFCCAGCAIVAGVIAANGLERFYALRESAAPARTTGRAYAELDDPAFARLHVAIGADGRARAALYLEDLRCGACAWLVESAPRCLPGVVDVRVDLGRGRADVTWTPATVPLSAIARHLDGLGHAVHPYRGLDREAARRREDRALLVKLGVAGAAAGNLMLLAIALYAGLFDAMAASTVTLFRWASLAVALPALGFAATPFFRTALAALRARRLHLDLPLSIGILAGLGWGAVNVIRGAGEIYFDSLAMLVFLLLVARWIVLRHQRRASSAAELLLALAPRRARRVDPLTREVTEVPIEAIAVGDLVAVRAGDTLPVDGAVLEGRSTLDAGLLTGESRPVEVAPGAVVHAGTVNLAAPLLVCATAVGEATRLGALAASIDALSARKADIERLVDRVAGRFVVAVTALAAATLVGWSLAVSVTAGAEHALALLVVTCPCALALATPLAVTVALGRAARRQILIKGADALERLATPGVLYLDKTGTLTAGRLAVASRAGDVIAVRLAAALEAASAHPVARALVAAEPDAADAVVAEAREELGRGIAGTVDGRAVVVGAPPWVGARAVGSAAMDELVAAAAARAETPIAVAVDGVVVAVVGLADPIRPDAVAAVAALAALGWQVAILSGDDPRVVAQVGLALGLPAARCTGGVTPEGKLAAVRAARARGPVVMVGDGINDTAALAAASCGIAVSGAAEAAIEAADVYLGSPAIGGIVEAARGARDTLATIRRSLRISLTYNAIAGVLAISGLIHPLLAAALMPLSSFSVLASSLRSRAFREPR